MQNIITYRQVSDFSTWILTATFYAFQMTLRVLPALMMNDIMTKYSMNVGEFGLLAGFYYLGYAGFQIPVGLMLDKFHPRFIIPLCIAMCVAGLGCFIYGELQIFAYIGRALIGAGSVGGILGAMKAIDDFFPTKYGFMLGITAMIGTAGAYFGGEPIKMLSQNGSFNDILQILSVIGLVLAAIIMISYNRSHVEDKAAQDISMLGALQEALSRKTTIFAGIFGGLMVGPLEGFADVWCSPYFVDVHNLDKATASGMMAAIFLGFGIGCPILGFLGDHIKNLPRLIALCGVAMIALFAALFSYQGFGAYAIYVICFLIGAFSAYQVVIFDMIIHVTEHHLVGVTSSILNMLIMVFGFVFHSAIGKVMDLFTPEIINGREIYDAAAYHGALSVIVIGLFIGSVGFLMLAPAIRKLKRD